MTSSAPQSTVWITLRAFAVSDVLNTLNAALCRIASRNQSILGFTPTDTTLTFGSHAKRLLRERPALPLAILIGWLRWLKQRMARTVFAVLSLIVFTLATCSGLLALGSLIYAHAIGGFPYYDHRLFANLPLGWLAVAERHSFGRCRFLSPQPARLACPAMCFRNVRFLGVCGDGRVNIRVFCPKRHQ